MKEFVIECENKEQNDEIDIFYNRHLHISYWEYLIVVNNKVENEWSNREFVVKRYLNYLIISFQEWKQMINKYTKEYLKANKVAVRCKNQEEVRVYYKAMNINNHHSHDEETICSVTKNGFSSFVYKGRDEHFLEDGYEIIEFSQLNLKTEQMEIKVGMTTKDFIKPGKGRIQCYKDSIGTKYGGSYDLLEPNLSGRKVKKVENGYFEMEGFGYGWFKISDVINNNNNTMEKKILGYKIIKHYPGIKAEYVGQTILAPLYILPDKNYIGGEIFNKESPYYNTSFINEFFSPVYEEEALKIGNWAIAKDENNGIFKFAFKVGKIDDQFLYHTNNSNNRYISDFRKATTEEIRIAEENNKVEIGGYTAEKVLGINSDTGKPGVKFGCQFLSLEELYVVEKLLNNEIKADITIHGTKINKEIINKLKNL